MSIRYAILIVEDEELFADQMEMQVHKLGHEVLGIVDNSQDALHIIEKNRPDLILMDIRIEGEYDGIELTDLIHLHWDIPVIFVSAYSDDPTFRRITRTCPLGFISKPFTEVQLQRSIELALTQLQEVKRDDYSLESESPSKKYTDFIFIRKKQKLEKVRIADIFYLEADGRYCQIHLIDRKYLIQSSLRELAQRLPENDFIQTHRSFIVNINKIQSIDLENDVIVLESMHVPISRREREKVLSSFDLL